MLSVDNGLFDKSWDETLSKTSSPVEEYSGQQLALLQSLGKLDDHLEKMYRGTLQVLESDNVNKYALAAHGLRELIEKLPQHFGLRQKAHNEQLGALVNDVCAVWEKTLRTTSCMSNETWMGEIDDALRKCLVKVDNFVSTFRTNNPRRREEVVGLIHALDPGRGRLPNELEDSNVKAIQQMRSTFVKVAHHRECPSEHDFMLLLSGFEQILLARLCPRTFEDHDTIDAIIREVVGHD